MRKRVLIAAVLAGMSVAGCATVGYYGQAAQGHLAMMAAARPIPEVLADPATSDRLRERLAAASDIRRFATDELGLPDNRSYTSYADLKRPAVVWNVFATPELSLQLKTWCYPVFGCAGYRGYFDQGAADALATELRGTGYDVNVAPVPAYSTLGWFSDPLLNTFIFSSDAELARLIFHELSHQVVYVSDDTVFNESFATAVEREGVRRWLAVHGNEAQRAAWATHLARREEFLDLLMSHRRMLEEVYASSATVDEKRAAKAAVFADLKRQYRLLRDGSWGGFAGYDRFFEAPLGSAHLAAVGAYNDLVPAFDALLAENGGDLPAFYAEVRRIGAMDPAARMAEMRRRLAQLAGRGSVP